MNCPEHIDNPEWDKAPAKSEPTIWCELEKGHWGMHQKLIEANGSHQTAILFKWASLRD